MTGFSLRQAATAAGTSKTSIVRAIQSGRLSAARTDTGGWAIEPAELFRAFPPKPAPDRTGDGPTDQTVPGVLELQARVRHLEEQLAEARRNAERAHEIATKALERPLMLPAPEMPQRRAWWPWRRAG